jgi:predicted NAD/FAD-dependent oxidoreductase
LPGPAFDWLQRSGVRINLAHRVGELQPHASGWQVDADSYDRVVLATTAVEAARLTAGFAADWSHRAAALRYEPIVTLYLRSAGSRLSEPMLVLPTTPAWPAQFVFDRGQLGGPAGLLVFVVSGAQTWVERGSAATLRAVREQAEASLGRQLSAPLEDLKVVTEQRATFRCIPGLERPAQAIAPGLCAAGDFVDGPYPATLEGAVRSGVSAARRL